MGNRFWTRWSGFLGGVGDAAAVAVAMAPAAVQPAHWPTVRARMPVLGQALGQALDGDEATINSQVVGYALVQDLRAQVADILGQAHGASLVCAVGVLCGLACVEGLRRSALANGLEPEQVLREHRPGDGNTYYSGYLVERVLLEQHPSLWSINAATARQDGLGSDALPNLGRLQARVQATRGTVDFGRIHGEPAMQPLRQPLEWLALLWPDVEQMLQASELEPAQWHLALALAGRQVCREDAAGMAVADRLRLLMESALVGSSVSPAYRPRRG